LGVVPGAGLIGPGVVAGRMRARSGLSAQRGVSLLEMLMVIVLIAAIGVLTVAALNGGMAGMQLRSSSKEIAAQLRYTRSQAIATGRSQKFTIDPGAHSWTAPNGRKGDIPQSIGIIFTGARELQPRPGEGAVMFFSDGASTGGRVKLSAKQAAWNVDVAWLTGEVKLKRGEAPR
jgi:general secretion pathway protein H